MLSFENEDDLAFFNKYYTPTVEIKDYNVVIEKMKKVIEMDKNNDYITGNL